MKEIIVNIFELISSAAAVSTADGESLFDRIKKAFESDIKVILDFNNIELITSTFLNSSVGRLYGHYDQEFIKDHLGLDNMSNDDLVLLKKVVDRAKEYFKEREKLDKAIGEALGEEDDDN